MKKSLLIIVMAVLAVSLASCTRSLPERITSLADKVEAKGDKYSIKDWEKVADKFASMVLEFADNYDSYKPSEKIEVYKAAVRFSAKAVKCGATEVLNKVDFQSVIDSVNGGVNDAVKGAKDLLKNLGF